MAKIRIFDYPDELYYTDEHIWLRIEGDTVRVGLSDFGQYIAGDINKVRAFPAGKPVTKGRPFAFIGTGKWGGQLRSPITGKIKEINEKVKKDPSLVNRSPYDDGWFAVLEPQRLEEDLKDLFFGEEGRKRLDEDIVKRARELCDKGTITGELCDSIEG